MEFAFALEDVLRGGIAAGSGRDESGAPEWSALHARFAAAHAARAALEGVRAGQAAIGGFAECAAPGGTGFASRAVNPIASADGKNRAGMKMRDAGNADSGSRG